MIIQNNFLIAFSLANLKIEIFKQLMLSLKNEFEFELKFLNKFMDIKNFSIFGLHNLFI